VVSRTHGDVHDEGDDGVHGLLEGGHLLPHVVQLLVQPLLGAAADGGGRRGRRTSGSRTSRSRARWEGGAGSRSHKLTTTSAITTGTGTSTGTGT